MKKLICSEMQRKEQESSGMLAFTCFQREAIVCAFRSCRAEASMNRREFCAAAGLAVAAKSAWGAAGVDVAAVDRERVLRAANAYLKEKPVTVTAAHSPRSAGGLHDFYSEGDYWGPDPKNPGGSYTRREGEANPQNFTAHREAMVRLSVQVPALAAAWKITRDAALRKRYAAKVSEHL